VGRSGDVRRHADLGGEPLPRRADRHRGACRGGLSPGQISHRKGTRKEAAPLLCSAPQACEKRPALPARARAPRESAPSRVPAELLQCDPPACVGYISPKLCENQNPVRRTKLPRRAREFWPPTRAPGPSASASTISRSKIPKPIASGDGHPGPTCNVWTCVRLAPVHAQCSTYVGESPGRRG